MRFGWLIALSILLVACETPAGNQNPSVSAGTDINAVERTVVTLTGVVSDSDGSIAGLEWTQVSGPEGTLSATDTEEVTLTLPSLSEEATLTFRLTATDDEGASASADVSVSVELVQTDVIALESSDYATCAIAQNGAVKCWGDGGSFNLGNGDNGLMSDTEAGSEIPELDFGTDTPTFVEAGEELGCALFENGIVKCWGRKQEVGLNDLSSYASDYVGDTSDELGDGLPIIDLGNSLTAVQLSVGNEHACVVLNDGGVKCWGEGSSGKLGNGTTQSIGDVDNQMGDSLPYVDLGTDGDGVAYTAKYVEAGYNLTCAILNDDQLKCWGDNYAAQLGYGDSNNRGDEPNEMGDNLPLVDLGTGRSASQVFVYYEHVCAVLDNGALKCWGTNNDGEVGLGTGDDVIGNNVPPSNRSYVQCNSGADVARTKVEQINVGDASCLLGGYSFSIGLDTGGNEIYQIPYVSGRLCEKHDVNVVYSDTTIDPGPVCAEGGKSLAWDYDANGDGFVEDGSQNFMGDALPEIDLGSEAGVIDVSLGDDHTCALLTDNTLKCWGHGSDGETGMDSVESWGDDSGETPATRGAVNLGTGLYATQIAGAYYYNCALLNNGKVKCWGYDQELATLGVPDYFKDEVGNGQPASEMGDNLQYLNLFRDTP